jgi:hypothetical protein
MDASEPELTSERFELESDVSVLASGGALASSASGAVPASAPGAAAVLDVEEQPTANATRAKTATRPPGHHLERVNFREMLT